MGAAPAPRGASPPHTPERESESPRRPPAVSPQAGAGGARGLSQAGGGSLASSPRPPWLLAPLCLSGFPPTKAGSRAPLCHLVSPVILGLFPDTSDPQIRDWVRGRPRPGETRSLLQGLVSSSPRPVCGWPLTTCGHSSDPTTGSHSRGRAFFPGPSTLVLSHLGAPSGPRSGLHLEQVQE